jgi:hypothetical protein
LVANLVQVAVVVVVMVQLAVQAVVAVQVLVLFGLRPIISSVAPILIPESFKLLVVTALTAQQLQQEIVVVAVVGLALVVVGSI